jgi:hypothetical protein
MAAEEQRDPQIRDADGCAGLSTISTRDCGKAEAVRVAGIGASRRSCVRRVPKSAPAHNQSL